MNDWQKNQNNYKEKSKIKEEEKEEEKEKGKKNKQERDNIRKHVWSKNIVEQMKINNKEIKERTRGREENKNRN